MVVEFRVGRVGEVPVHGLHAVRGDGHTKAVKLADRDFVDAFLEGRCVVVDVADGDEKRERGESAARPRALQEKRQRSDGGLL